MTSNRPFAKRLGGRKGVVSDRLRVSALTAVAVAASAVASPDAAQSLVAGGAGAVPGGCLRDNSPLSAADSSCGLPVAGLMGATALAAGGRDVYVAAMDSDAVVALRADAGGALHPVSTPSSASCVAAPEHAICNQRASGLDGADAAAVSADGRNVYVGSLDSAAVVAFARTRGGRLIPLRGRGACVQGNPVTPGAGGGCLLHDGAMQGVSSVAVSPDGRFVYALSAGTSADADSLVTLRRDPRHGNLAPVPAAHGGCVVPLGNHSCKVHAAGLRGATHIVLSQDGRFAYVAGELSSAVVAFRRDAHSGALKPLHGSGGCAQDTIAPPAPGDARCVVLAPGLGGAKSIALSSDGKLVYVASFDPGGIAVLARDPNTGTLGPLPGTASPAPGTTAPPGGTTGPTGPTPPAPSTTACLVPAGPDPPPAGCAQLDGLRGASAVALFPDGRTLYVATTTGDALLRIALDPTTGLLGAAAPTHPIGSFDAPAALIAPFARSLYLASPIDDSVLALTAD